MKNGIFCIETPWEVTGEVSVAPALNLLANYHGAPFECRKAGSPDEFNRRLAEWDAKDDFDHAVLYLGFHGFPQGVEVKGESGHKSLWDYVRLDQLADFAEGRWGRCLVHMASCSTMEAGGPSVGDFLKRTGLEAVSGYAADVDWIESMAFELIYLNMLLEVVGDRYLWADPLRACRDRLRESNSWELAKALEFRLKLKDDYDG